MHFFVSRNKMYARYILFRDTKGRLVLCGGGDVMHHGVARVRILDIDVRVGESEHVVCQHCKTVWAVRDLVCREGNGIGKEKTRYFYCGCDGKDAVVYDRGGNNMILSFPGPSWVVRSKA